MQGWADAARAGHARAGHDRARGQGTTGRAQDTAGAQAGGTLSSIGWPTGPVCSGGFAHYRKPHAHNSVTIKSKKMGSRGEKPEIKSSSRGNSGAAQWGFVILTNFLKVVSTCKQPQ